MRCSRWLVALMAVMVGTPGIALRGKCSSGEAKATGKKASCKAGVFSKAAAKATDPDAGKLAACESKFGAAFSKAQSSGDCSSAVTAAGTEAKVDAFVNDVNGEIAV